jgi:DNA-binding transcriptional LysR family regulator
MDSQDRSQTVFASRYLFSPQLVAFLAVVEAGRFSEAATRLHITQSALSKRIRLLEQNLRVTLVQRGKAPLKPTAAGERLLAYATQVRALEQQLLTDLHLNCEPHLPRRINGVNAALALVERAREHLYASLHGLPMPSEP